MLSKEMAQIDWNKKSSKDIKNLVRGLDPIIGAYTFINNKKIKIWKVNIISNEEFAIKFNIEVQKYKNGEVLLGRVAKENYDNIKHLIEKILTGYDFIINITHLDDFKDFCEYHVTVTKENNVSRINLK